MPSYTGNPMGSGNPPGEHSDAYLKHMTSSDGHFQTKASYRSPMHVGMKESATMVGNQPKQKSTSSVEKFVNSPALR